MKSKLKIFSGTMPLKIRVSKRNCLIRGDGEFCVYSEAISCMVEKGF
jgi:hypothetical protein